MIRGETRTAVRLLITCGCLATALPLLGQAPLQVSVSTNGAANTVAAGGSATLTSAGVGQIALATVTVKYTGSSSAAIQGVAFSGTAFTLASAPAFPIQLSPQGTTSFSIQYLASSGASVTNVLSISVLENTQSSVFAFNLTGTAPDLAFTYYFLPNGTLTALNPNDHINFGSTNVGSTSSATINILNRGSAPGAVQSVTLTGADFGISGSPAPATVQAGQQVSFTISFTPHAAGTSSGLLSVGLANSSPIFLISGLGGSPSLTVQYKFADNNVHALTSGVTVSFPSVDINATSTATFDILNQGTGSGTITGISVTGSSFVLSGAPPLPSTVAAAGDVKFSVIFAPTQPGTYTGTLVLNLNGTQVSATLTASTNPANLTVSYALADGNSRPLVNGSLISFPSVDVNSTTTTAITVVNQGTGAAVVTGISVSGSGFLLTGLPILPATVAAGQTLKFSIVFSPTQSGSFAGSFLINGTGLSIGGTLSGSTSAPNFSVSYTLSDGITHALPDGTAITYSSIDVNVTTPAAITVLNQGPGSGTITGIFVAGTGFQVSGAPQLPTTVPAGQSAHFSIVFAPTKTGNFTGTFRIDLTGSSISGTLTASTAAPSFSVSYIDPNTNVLPLPNNSTLQFPATLVGTAATVTVQAANAGAGTGSINSITLGSANSPFQLVSPPSFPLSVPPQQQARFGIRFSPQQKETVTDTLSINFNGQVTTINLAAQTTQAQYTYGWSNGVAVTLLTAGSTLALGDTTAGQTTSVTVSVTNSGTGDGQITTINASGPGVSLTSLPALPLTLHAGDSQKFTLTFAPTQPGTLAGQLVIGNDTFPISGTALGSRLTYAYTSGSSAVPVGDAGTVIFAPIAVGNTETLTFSIQNTGTAAATISSINLAAASSVFPLSQLPALPLNLDPGATTTFTIGFTPNNTGSLTGTLHVNNSSFTLTGNGNQPPGLPGYQFQGSSTNPQPAQQPAIGLTLAAPYAYTLKGTLALTFVSSVFTDDPSIQFATGGRTVNFTIPANTTQALFTGNATSMPLQTGTTAGTIVITPAFTMQSGFELTPNSAPALTLVIPKSAPQLLNASISSETQTSFTLTLSGYSTTRAMRQFDIQITPKQGQAFATTHLTVDVNSPATAWFQSTASQGFGGSFYVAIPFTLSNGSTTDDLVHMLQSLSITAANETGTSSAVTVTIP